MVIPAADREKWWRGDVSTTNTKGKRKSTKPVKRTTKKPVASTSTSGVVKLPPHQKTTFPVVLTTYEIVIRDSTELAAYRWGFVVVDEGHRLKNMECRLIKELKSLNADARMVLTGTPLHVRAVNMKSIGIADALFTEQSG